MENEFVLYFPGKHAGNANLGKVGVTAGGRQKA